MAVEMRKLPPLPAETVAVIDASSGKLTKAGREFFTSLMRALKDMRDGVETFDGRADSISGDLTDLTATVDDHETRITALEDEVF